MFVANVVVKSSPFFEVRQTIMKKHLALPLVLAMASLAACSSLRSKTPEAAPTPAETAPAAPASAPTNTAPSANASAAASNGSLSASALAAQQAREQAAAAAAQQQSAAQAQLDQRTVHFDYDQYAIQPGDIALLQVQATYLAGHQQAKVRVEGNTDERGTPEYNMALGERRAKAVQAFLTTHGVSAGQLTVVSYGLEKPVDSGHTEAAWAKNRRVDLDYLTGAP